MDAVIGHAERITPKTAFNCWHFAIEDIVWYASDESW